MNRIKIRKSKFEPTLHMYYPLNYNIMSTNEEKKSPWSKILKLFLEFVVAAITAFVTATSGNAMGIW